ncbi:MAG: 5'-deoxynucleotidase [Clostridia bacterium]|nr:5'-deoxynucleotidase [Clostridia bacterium]
MQDSFFAMLSRMKYINRWALMRNTSFESLSEHSLEVAVIAHALAVINNVRFQGNLNPERAAVLAIFHDAPEILTGDMPTPVKYYNEEIRSAYKQVESAAVDKLVGMLPDDLQDAYKELLMPGDAQYKKIIKAADKISAIIKCIAERRAGNCEFLSAEKSTLELIENCGLPEAKAFLEEFIPAYTRTLDEQ